ncbi:MAG: YggS family pyridoxal phosphate-dependent enzyme [Fretibacterium sp.]|nr:YggS family pyridoxal phosphate-dependent enzyme [Fretibacterium sp.]
MTFEERIGDIRERIACAAEKAGRDPKSVLLVAVTKTRTVQEMLAAVPFAAAIGENRIQEAEKKRKIWPADGPASVLPWRLIGHLQGNKVRKALELFDTVDSLDSIALAERLERVAAEMERTLPVLIEVNMAQEGSKTGIAPEAFGPLLERVRSLPHLHMEGLMTIGPMTDDEASVRRVFAALRDLAEEARKQTGLPLPVLSMGMSGDFEWAIQEGSTMVRIGSALFGPRNYC